MNYKKIIRQAIDLHVHVGPEIIPRKFTVQELVREEKGRLGGFGLKNHFFPTVAMSSGKENGGLVVINSVVLNEYVGGFNAGIVRASAELSKNRIIVWFPTISSANALSKQKFEISPEWISEELRRKIKIRKAKDVVGLTIFDRKGKISKDVIDVLKTIKKYGAILATGHLSSRETYVLVKYAVKTIGLKRIIITHPIYQKIDMPLSTQRELAEFGAFIEHSFSMYSIDKIPMEKIIDQILYVGADKCILTSDVGQSFSQSPSKSLEKFVNLLVKGGISESDIRRMLIDNPRKLCLN